MLLNKNLLTSFKYRTTSKYLKTPPESDCDGHNKFAPASHSLAVADTGKGPRGPVPPLFLDQTEARRTQFFFFWRLPPPLSKGLDERVPLISRCGSGAV